MIFYPSGEFPQNYYKSCTSILYNSLTVCGALCFSILLGKGCTMIPMALWLPSVGTHQYVSSHNAAFHSVCHLTHVPHQNNYTLYIARSPRPAYRNTNIATEEQNVFWALFRSFELSWIEFHRVCMWAAPMLWAMITELVQGKHFFPIWSQAEVLCFAEIISGFQGRMDRILELPQMPVQKVKNRSALVCFKWLNRTACSKMRPHETWHGKQNAEKSNMKVKILPCDLNIDE